MPVKQFLLAAAAVTALATPVAAQSVSASNPSSIADAIRDMGYRADVDTDSYGDPEINSAANGVNFTIFFYRCDDRGEDCEDIQFSAGFDLNDGISMRSVNSWNDQKAVGRAFVDDEDDPYLQHYVVGVDGMSRYVFEKTFYRWVDVLDEFTDFIDW